MSQSAEMDTVRLPELRYTSRHVEVLGANMHYLEHGTGDPILFLHGQPTWSYLWRNVMPELEGAGRLLALDLIGYGLSERPVLAYEVEDHIRYLDAFIKTQRLERLTLVGHDWGSFLAFHFARRHPERVKALAFMEAMLDPIPGYEAFDEQTGEFFARLRSSQQTAEYMMVEQNLFIEGVLPALVQRSLKAEEMDAYRAPWVRSEDRRILCKFPQNLCIGGEPAAIHRLQRDYMAWLESSDVPKLLIHADPGLLISPDTAADYRQRLPNTEVAAAGAGLHYFQEDQPEGIGRAIRGWMHRNGI